MDADMDVVVTQQELTVKEITVRKYLLHFSKFNIFMVACSVDTSHTHTLNHAIKLMWKKKKRSWCLTFERSEFFSVEHTSLCYYSSMTKLWAKCRRYATRSSYENVCFCRCPLLCFSHLISKQLCFVCLCIK